MFGATDFHEAFDEGKPPLKLLPPRAWAVKDYADGWIIYDSEEMARGSQEAGNGATVLVLKSTWE